MTSVQLHLLKKSHPITFMHVQTENELLRIWESSQALSLQERNLC